MKREHDEFQNDYSISRDENQSENGTQSNDSHSDSGLSDGPNPKPTNSKRPRTILNQAQRKLFKSAFESTPKPCRKVY